MRVFLSQKVETSLIDRDDRQSLSMVDVGLVNRTKELRKELEDRLIAAAGRKLCDNLFHESNTVQLSGHDTVVSSKMTR